MGKYDELTIAGAPLSDAEKFVLEQVEAGELADLKEKFGEAEEKRRLRAAFLEALLTDGMEGLKPHRRGIMIGRAVVAEALDLENAEISAIVSLTGCIFEKEVIFRDARCRRHLIINGTEFRGAANFHRVKVEFDLLCRDTVFQGPVNFGAADIGGQFSASGAHFEGQGQENEANFNGLKVGQHAFLNKAVFQGPVDFIGADIGGQFSAESAQFESESHKANFNAMKVDQDAFFDNAIFRGPVNFSGADINGQFIADKAQFLHETPADFEGIKVQLATFFRDTVFQGVIELNNAGLLDLIINQKTSSTHIPQINVERTVVQREFRIEDAKIDVLQASHLEVRGPATFENVMMKQSVDLRDSTFQTLNLIKSTWPKNEEEVRLEGLTYNAINAGTGKEDWKKLLAWIKGSRFNTQVYSQLENYFQRCGHRERANQVFISMKDREGEMAPDMGRRLWNRFLKITIGYGRRPWLALLISLFFFILGVIAFWDSEGMVRKKIHTESGLVITSQSSEAPRPRYDPLWYSLDLLLPIDLDMAKHWEPNPERSLAWHYAKLQIIIGWVLIGVLIVAAAGIIK